MPKYIAGTRVGSTADLVSLAVNRNIFGRRSEIFQPLQIKILKVVFLHHKLVQLSRRASGQELVQERDGCSLSVPHSPYVAIVIFNVIRVQRF